MLGRAVKESPPGYLVKVDVPEKVRVRVLSKWVFFSSEEETFTRKGLQ